MFQQSVRYNSFLWVGFTLQLFFIFMYISSLLTGLPPVLAAVFCLIIGFTSLLCGILLLKINKPNYVYAIGLGMILIASIIILFTIFAYFLGEPGQSPIITF
ncbi:hypothetical protein AZ46_0204110 [Metabacillus indicus LMG 22858]|nr:hypothetical protein AZ46_0204110 [Metabacillus indicus LMG 22858]